MADDLSTDTLTFEGSEPLKSIEVKDGVARVGAYAIRFSPADEKDLTGEFFTAKTNLGPSCGNGAATLFNHAIPLADGSVFAEFAEREFGTVKATRDEIGVFVETNLDLSDKHARAVADLCAKGKLKWSSGAASHMVRKSADGEILRWHPVEFSFTPTPAEPRLPAIRPLKSLPASATDAADLTAAMKAAAVDTTPATKPVLSPTLMTPEEKAAAEKAQNEAISTATKARLLEVNEITALGNHFKCADVANTFIGEGKSLDAFRQHVLENVKNAVPVVTDPRVGMSKREVKSWSFLKAVREWATGGGAHALTGVEKEASDATATIRAPLGVASTS